MPKAVNISFQCQAPGRFRMPSRPSTSIKISAKSASGGVYSLERSSPARTTPIRMVCRRPGFRLHNTSPGGKKYEQRTNPIRGGQRVVCDERWSEGEQRKRNIGRALRKQLACCEPQREPQRDSEQDIHGPSSPGYPFRARLHGSYAVMFVWRLLDNLDTRQRDGQRQPITAERRMIDPHLESAMLPSI